MAFFPHPNTAGAAYTHVNNYIATPNIGKYGYNAWYSKFDYVWNQNHRTSGSVSQKQQAKAQAAQAQAAPPPPAPPPAAPPAGAPPATEEGTPQAQLEKLAQLAELYQQGILNAEEFAAKAVPILVP